MLKQVLHQKLLAAYEAEMEETEHSGLPELPPPKCLGAALMSRYLLQLVASSCNLHFLRIFIFDLASCHTKVCEAVLQSGSRTTFERKRRVLERSLLWFCGLQSPTNSQNGPAPSSATKCHQVPTPS